MPGALVQGSGKKTYVPPEFFDRLERESREDMRPRELLAVFKGRNFDEFAASRSRVRVPKIVKGFESPIPTAVGATLEISKVTVASDEAG